MHSTICHILQLCDFLWHCIVAVPVCVCGLVEWGWRIWSLNLLHSSYLLNGVYLWLTVLMGCKFYLTGTPHNYICGCLSL